MLMFGLLVAVELVRVLFFLAGLALLAFVIALIYWIFYAPLHAPTNEARERLIAQLNAEYDERRRR